MHKLFAASGEAKMTEVVVLGNLSCCVLEDNLPAGVFGLSGLRKNTRKKAINKNLIAQFQRRSSQLNDAL